MVTFASRQRARPTFFAAMSRQKQAAHGWFGVELLRLSSALANSWNACSTHGETPESAMERTGSRLMLPSGPYRELTFHRIGRIAKAAARFFRQLTISRGEGL